MRFNSFDHLAPEFRRRLERLMTLLGAENILLAPFETIRAPSRQDELYARGRDPALSDYGRTVTRARRYQSAHQFGVACDLVFFVGAHWTWEEPEPGQWSRLRHLAGECGLESLSFEQPHVQIENFSWKNLTPGPADDSLWLEWLRGKTT